MSRLIAIGDIHGSLGKFKSLVDNINLQPGDRIRFLGDVINRGPDTKGVVDLILELSKNYDVKSIMGNHEEILLASKLDKSTYKFLLKIGGIETLRSYGIEPPHTVFKALDLDLLPPDHLLYYARMHDYLVEDGFILTHAGVKHSDDLDKQISERLRWGNLPVGGHKSGMTVVCGHISLPEPIVSDTMIAIDTGSYKENGYITAIDLTTLTTWRSDVIAK